MDEISKILWEKVCETVNKLGSPRSARIPKIQTYEQPSILDLHGMKIQEAYDSTQAFLRCFEGISTTVTIVTGKSGKIRKEFPDWLEQSGIVASYEEINNGGAFLVRLKKK